jgi:ribosomal protein S27AE
MTGETVQMAAQKSADPIWVCGGCGAPLAVGMQPGQMLGRVLRCGKCRSYNRVEMA